MCSGVTSTCIETTLTTNVLVIKNKLSTIAHINQDMARHHTVALDPTMEFAGQAIRSGRLGQPVMHLFLASIQFSPPSPLLNAFQLF